MQTEAQKKAQRNYRKKHSNKWKEYYTKNWCEKRELLSGLKINGCAICGYNKCSAALEFHHVINNKKFPLKLGVIHSRTIKSIFNEVNKCVLLCANCHRELHNPP